MAECALSDDTPRVPAVGDLPAPSLGASPRPTVTSAPRRTPIRVDTTALPYKIGEKGCAHVVISIEACGLGASIGVPTALVSPRTTIRHKNGTGMHRATEVCRRSSKPDAQTPIDTIAELLALQARSELGPKRMGKVLEQRTETCAAEVTSELVPPLKATRAVRSMPGASPSQGIASAPSLEPS